MADTTNVDIVRPDAPRVVFSTSGSSGIGGCQPSCHVFFNGALYCLCGGRSRGGESTLAPAPTGWICPRCGAANAPFVQRCSCPAPTSYATDTGTPPASDTRPEDRRDA